jgi:hypothetical protein
MERAAAVRPREAEPRRLGPDVLQILDVELQNLDVRQILDGHPDLRVRRWPGIRRHWYAWDAWDVVRLRIGQERRLREHAA